jgi:hypothetical protein
LTRVVIFAGQLRSDSSSSAFTAVHILFINNKQQASTTINSSKLIIEGIQQTQEEKCTNVQLLENLRTTAKETLDVK